MFKKIIIAIVCIFCFLGIVGACLQQEETPPKGITSIAVNFESLSLKKGDSVKRYATVEFTDGFTESDVVFKVSDPSVASVTFSEISLTNYVYFSVQGLSAGETTLTIENKDGSVKSAEIRITVTDPGSDGESTQSTDKAPASTSDKTSSTTSKPASTSTTKPSSATSSQKPQTSDTTTDAVNDGTVETPNTPSTPTEPTVYVYPNGSVYHTNDTCSRKNNAPTAMSKSAAESKGYRACKNCD